MRQGRILYLEGIRGATALGVFLSHFCVTFYPAFYSAQMAEAHAGRWDVWVAASGLSPLYSGFLALPMLLLLSGYVLGLRFFSRPGEPAGLAGRACLRYFRLVLPVLVSVLLSWLLMERGVYANREAMEVTASNWFLGNIFLQPLPLVTALRQGLWDCFLVGGDLGSRVSLNPVLWTMGYELLGSYLLFAFLALAGRSGRRWLVYAVLLAVTGRGYFLAFALGLLLCDLLHSSWGERWRAYIAQPLCRWGLLAAGWGLTMYFPDGRNAWSALLGQCGLQAWGVDLVAFYHVLGAGLVFLALVQSQRAVACLSAAWLVELGRISFSFYLLHLIVLQSLGCSGFLWLYGGGAAYGLSAAVAGGVSLAMTLVLAWWMTRWVEVPANCAVRWMQRRFFS